MLQHKRLLNNHQHASLQLIGLFCFQMKITEQNNNFLPHENTRSKCYGTFA